ncbi:BvgS-like domain-containing signal transduction protein (PAS domain) [Arcobacter venerupis]|uniref:BvgS-like domain-containing signal transduction protein (PAS domain) n=1 Tax=Arcobacter venerupis TaxID=1054033 RepID=A0AAE7BCL7_9BACT|nr:transporter substrate-binding domain-containing protein [Arcobacter venerupis]QKF67939.1 BvgS-like domain-containing signal transduction protein (PAS domain) [Arcobacter venerupis]
MFKIVIACLILLNILFASQKQNSNITENLSLSKEEQQWIKNNPVIKIAITNYWTQFENINTDVIKLLNKYGNLNIVLIKYETWKDAYNDSINGINSYGILNLSWSQEREDKYFYYTKAYNFTPSQLIVKKTNTDILSLNDLENKTVYTREKSIARKILEEEVPSSNIVDISDEISMFNNLSQSQKSEAIFDFVSDTDLINSFDLKIVKNIYNKYSEVSIGISKKHPELQNIINKIYEIIPKDELLELQNRIYLKEKKKTFISLNSQEKEWLDEHLIIKVGNEPDYAPWDFNRNNEPLGYSIDYIKLLASKLGVKIEFVQDSWGNLNKKLENKQVDLLHTMYKNNSKKGVLYTDKYKTVINAIYVHEDNTNIQSSKDLEDKTISIPKGDSILISIKDNFPNAKIIEPDGYVESLKNVALKRSDATILDMAVANYLKNEFTIPDLKIIDQIKFSSKNLVHSYRIGVRDDYPILVSLLNKAINSLTEEELQKLDEKWLLEPIQKKDQNSLNLSKEEQTWLNKKETIKFSVDPNWFPIEGINKETGKYQGMISDIIEKIKELSGMQFELIPTNTWSESIDLIKSKKIDMLSAVSVTPEKEKFLNFSHTSIELNDGVIMRSDAPFISSLEDLKGLKVGIPDGNGLEKTIKDKYPELSLIPIKGVKNSLEQLNSKKIDAYIGNLEVSSFLIFQESFFNLKIALSLNEKRAVKIAINKEYPKEAIQIINKALEKISPEELQTIKKRWIGIKLEDKTDYSLIWKFSAAFISIVLLFAYYNRKLKLLVAKKTAQLQSLLESFDTNVIASRTDLKGNITYASKALCQISGYSNKELIGSSQNIVRHPDTKEEIFEELWQTITNGKIWKGELKNAKKDAGFYWLDIIITPEFDDNEEIIAFSVIGENITAKKEVEELSKNLEQKVEERTYQLKQNQEQMKFVSHYANLGFWTFNPQVGDLLVNDTFVQMLGYDANEVLIAGCENEMFKPFKDGLAFWEQLIHEEDREKTAENINAHINGETNLYKSEYRMKKADGSWMWSLDIGRVAQRDKDGKAIEFNGVNLDIQDAKNAQELISQNKLFLNSLLDSQEQIVITKEGKTLRSVNKKFLEFFDVKNINEFTKDYECICDKFVIDETNTYLQKDMKKLSWIEYVIKNSNKTNKVVMEKDNIQRIFSVTAAVMPIGDGTIKSAVFTDITELEFKKKQTDTILSSVLLPMIITSKKTRKIVYANTFAEEQYETTLDELIGLDIEVFYTSDNQRDTILAELNSKGILQNFETTFKTLKGKKFDAILSLVDISFGGEDCFLGVASDITQQKELQKEIESIHRHTRESIEYASLIQHALIPSNDLFRKYFSDYLTIWHPKDIVGGDIYLFEELRNDNECLLMVIDCTGHGVPGAFVTMLVKAIERQITSNIINSNEVVSPAKILSIFNRSMKHLLKQEDNESISNAGFDGGILYYNKKEKIVKFAGAETGLFYIEDEELKMIKGSRHSVGYKKSDANFEFKEFIIDVKDGMQFYLTTDGYLDQNGGDKSFPFGKKRFKKILEENYNLPFADQQEILLYDMQAYQGEEERNDDITIVGIKI